MGKMRGWGRYQVTHAMEAIRVTCCCDAFSGGSFQGFL
jgi:hypothetical protein